MFGNSKGWRQAVARGNQKIRSGGQTSFGMKDLRQTRKTTSSDVQAATNRMTGGRKKTVSTSPRYTNADLARLPKTSSPSSWTPRARTASASSNYGSFMGKTYRRAGTGNSRRYTNADLPTQPKPSVSSTMRIAQNLSGQIQQSRKRRTGFQSRQTRWY